MYELVEAEDIGYAIGLPANKILQNRIDYFAQAPGRTTAARGTPLLRQLQLSQWIKRTGRRSNGLGCHALLSFATNTVRLQLHALAYNLGDFMRTLAMPKATEPWSLTNLREKLIRIGAKVVSRGRYVTFQLAEVACRPIQFAV